MSIGEWILVIGLGVLLVAVVIALRSEPSDKEIRP